MKYSKEFWPEVQQNLLLLAVSQIKPKKVLVTGLVTIQKLLVLQTKLLVLNLVKLYMNDTNL